MVSSQNLRVLLPASFRKNAARITRAQAAAVLRDQLGYDSAGRMVSQTANSVIPSPQAARNLD